MEKIILKSEDKMYQSEIVKFLQEIAMKTDTGVVKLVQGEESVELVIPQNLTLELKVVKK